MIFTSVYTLGTINNVCVMETKCVSTDKLLLKQSENQKGYNLNKK